MVLQPRQDGTLRAFTQHDHGLVSGHLAHHWRAHGAPLAMELVLAITMHDYGWEDIDDIAAQDTDAIPFDEEAGILRGFTNLPTTFKLPLYAHGIREARAMHPYTGLLLSHHFSAFIPDEEYPEWTEQQRALRAECADLLGLSAPRCAEVLRDYEALKFFDLLSLYLCLAAPEAVPEAKPAWIPDAFEWLGHTTTMAFKDAETVSLDPFPYDAPIQFDLPYREFPRTSWPDAAALKQDWKDSQIHLWHITVEPA